MSEHGSNTKSNELARLMEANPHLEEYVEQQRREYREYPKVIQEEEAPEYEAEYPNLLYQVGDNVFIHIYGDRGIPVTYNAVEPLLEEGEKELFEQVRDRLLVESSQYEVPETVTGEGAREYVSNLLDEVIVSTDGSGVMDRVRTELGLGIEMSPETEKRIRYVFGRNIAGLGPLDPVMLDTNNEDIHVIGTDQCFVDNDPFGLVETNIDFGAAEEFDRYLKNLGERINNPVSDSNPVVDATLPDGSRINIVYSDDVSVKGPSLTIRQGEEVPLSILQITKWGTLSPKMCAYLWLCLENERTVFVVGETASGKTTTLNAILTFISNDSKIYTAEDTAEVLPPQDAWQQLLTRESPDEESTDVDMFNLVEAALRSRPDYIVVGEVRGEEAKMAFQAAQTGHPVLLTFHASDLKSMKERLTGSPINVPEPSIDNMDVVLFQNRVKRDDGTILRRVTNVTEVERYSDEAGGLLNRQVFEWDSASDEHRFIGVNNSYVLEEKVAELLGYEDNTAIYDELDRRTKIIERLIDAGYTDYYEVNGIIDSIQNDGVESVPIDTTGITK